MRIMFNILFRIKKKQKKQKKTGIILVQKITYLSENAIDYIIWSLTEDC